MKKWIKRIIALAVVAALAIWVHSRWHAWFGMPPEESYALSPDPQRILLTFGDADELSRNVSWQCDTMLHPSWLELKADGGTIDTIQAEGEVFASRGGKAAYYVARMRDLKPETEYSYRVATGGRISSWHRFRTHARGRDAFSFIYVGDVQDTIGGHANDFLLEAFRTHPEAEFLVCGGDLTERPQNMHWQQTFESIDSIAQALPVLCVTGNHDYLKGVVCKLERRFSLIFSYFLDSMEGNSQVYNLRYGNAEFFLLDSNRELPYLLKQKSWLKRKLDASGAKWKIVVIHHPLISAKGENNNMVQRMVFGGLVNDTGVDLVLQGHEHVYARVADRTGGSSSDSSAVSSPVYIISHCSPKSYEAHPGDRFDTFVPEGRSYQAITVASDSIVVETPGIERFVIVKPTQ